MTNLVLVVMFIALNLFTLNSGAPASFGSSGSEVPVRYDGAQLWAVDFADDSAKRFVAGLPNDFDVSLWSTTGSTVDLFLSKSAVDGGVGKILSDANIQYSVVIDDMQKHIDEANPPQAPENMRSVQSRSELGHKMTWTAYHRLDDVYSLLDYLVEAHPDLCSLQTIGYSLEKRPMKVLKISNGNANNKAVWIDGGIHAREWISPASVTYFVNDLVENWKDQPEYMQNIDWYVLSVLNPDGYEYTHTNDRLWRKNRNVSAGEKCGGVDLNRNFGYKWGGKGTSQNPCMEDYSGLGPFSEKESAATRDFFEKTDVKFFAYLTFHSYGQYILYPWGYDDDVLTDREDLDRVGKEGAKAIKAIDSSDYSVGQSATLLYPAAGGSDDWAKSIGVKYSYTVELRDKGRHGFVLPPEFIEATAKEAIAFIHTVAQAA